MTTENIADLLVSGLKCDNEACDYEDFDAKLEDYESYLNKPCPKCGESLLTPEDMETVNVLVKMTAMLNGMGLEPDDSERVNIEIKMKGDGSIELGDES